MKYFNYQDVPSIQVRLTIYRGKTKVKEDFSQASLFVFLVSAHDKIPVSVQLDNGVVVFNTPTTLDMGVYGVKAIWTKELGFSGQPAINAPYGMEIHADKTSRADIDNLFAIVNESSGTTTEGTIEASVEVATYGYDGLDAYEMAVIEGATKLTKKEWLESRSLTAVLQTEGENADASMSQKAVTDALDNIRTMVGGAYNVKGVVDTTLPTSAQIRDLYFKKDNKHSYVCTSFETQRTYGSYAWSSNIPPTLGDVVATLLTGEAVALPCSTADVPKFKLDDYNDTTKLVFGCDASGSIISKSVGNAVWIDGSTLKYGSNEDTSKCIGRVRPVVKDIGDAIYQDLGELTRNDYTPDAKDTSYEPSETSMLADTDNAQDALDKVGVLTPSMEQNQVLGANINTQKVNMNFTNLKMQNDKLIEVLQVLVERVMYNDPKGFKDMSELISSLQFEELIPIGRVTTGGTLSTDTSVVGYGKVGSAKVGKI